MKPVLAFRQHILGFVAALCCWSGCSTADEIRTLPDPVFHSQTRIYLAGPERAPVVVLVHGIGDNGARDWNPLLPKLARDFRVLTFDLPGFGRASKDNLPYTPDNYVAFIRHVIRNTVDRRPLTLVGHSMGAVLAMRYAARYPQDISALVLADMPGILHHLAYSQYLSQLGINVLPSLYPAQNAHLQNLATNLLGFFGKVKPAPELIVSSAALRKSLLGGDPAKIAGLALSIEDYGQDIDSIRAPTLLLWGGRDQVAPLRNARVLLANMENAQLEIFENSGHTPMEDEPELFTVRVASFLRAPRVAKRNLLLRSHALAPATDRIGRCRGQRKVVFEGDYDRIEIQSCRGVKIRNAKVRVIHIANAEVNIEDSMIGGTGTGGLVAYDARITITSSLIEADVAIQADDVRFNIAGSRIHGRRQAITAIHRSDALFSVSRVESPHFRGRLHGLRSVLPDKPL